MDNKRKNIYLLSYYSFPCNESLMEKFFAKEVAKYCDVNFIFFANQHHCINLNWHNSKIHFITRTYLPIIQYITALKYFIKESNSKKIDYIVVRDMPIFFTILTFFKMGSSIKCFQLTAPLGAMNIAYYKLSKKAKAIKRFIYGHIFNWFLDKAIKRADLIFPISKWHAESLRISKKKILPITMGIDSDWVFESYKDIPLVSNKRDLVNITYFGSLSILRNPKLIVDVLDLLASDHPEFMYFLVGKSESANEDEEIKKYINTKTHRNRIVFTGHLDKLELSKILLNSYITISAIPPTKYYSISSPTKLFESMGFGVPVVGNVGIYEQENVINESRAGLLVEYSAESFFKSISYLIQNPDVRAEMSSRAINYVSVKYNYKNLAKEFVIKLGMSCT